MRASLTRAGLQTIRIGAILAVIREVDSGPRPDLADRDSLAMNPSDMEAGLRLVLTHLMHALRVHTGLEGALNPR